jgi:hypothetical protein
MRRSSSEIVLLQALREAWRCGVHIDLPSSPRASDTHTRLYMVEVLVSRYTSLA